MRGNETIVRLRGAEKDRHGDPIPDTGDSKSYRGCLGYPRTSSENLDDSDIVVVGQAIYVPPPNADIVAEDQIQWRGDLWNVVGDPALFVKGRDKGIIINVERARG